MRTTAEIVREACNKATHNEFGNVDLFSKPRREAYYTRLDVRRMVELAATYACKLAQADAAALLEPVRMRKEDGGTRRE
jgi:hypothetical protein